MARKKRSHKPNTTDLNENDVITFLDQYFIDFEHNLRDNNFDKMNTALVKNIVDKFGIIFQLWDENRILQGSVDAKCFENIYKSMTNVFGSEDRSYEPINSNDFTLECNHCGEAFPLRNKDCRYSYDLHAISREHREFVENLNIVKDGRNHTIGAFERVLHDITHKLTELNITKQDSNVVSASRLAQPTAVHETRIITSKAPKKQISSVKKVQISSLKEVQPVTVFDAKCVIFRNGTLECKICGIKLPSEQNFIVHMTGKAHKTMIKRISWSTFMRKVNDEIHCSICGDYSCKKIESFTKHCESNGHIEKTKKSNIRLQNPIIQSEIAKVLPCPIPQCSSHEPTFKLLVQHLRSFHYLRIV